nr:lasso peptide biosynthesis PqqD family chaperone [Kibdelosporangium sp. MJ126-NF4]CEL12833.1 hypothetical protein [Kibdelosporangium sp. MJ126-NF4]CTQ98519.1 hypothetical protein [Kibdelosporangium sp. MJ126-NF4]
MTIALTPNVTATDSEDGLVLLNESTGRYWTLNGTGAATLRLLLAGNSPAQTASRLAERYPDAVDRTQRDVVALLAALRNARLVTSS